MSMNAPKYQGTPESVLAELRDIFAGPEYNWVDVRDPWAWARQVFDTIVQWFGDLYQHHPLIYIVLVASLVVVLVTVFVHFAFLIVQALKPRTGGARGGATGHVLIKDAGWYRREAVRSERDGNFVQALVMRFFALVLEMDRRELVVFNPSKTPIEYVHEARLPPDHRGQFQTLVDRLYAHVYGGEAVTPDALQDFERQASVLAGQHVA